MIEFSTYRYHGHHTFELKTRMKYRTEDEVARWKARDPLDIQAARVPAEVRERIDAEVEAELTDVVAFAVASGKPDPRDAMEYMYASGLRARAGAVD